MHFGLNNFLKHMQVLISILFILGTISACNPQQQQKTIVFSSPSAGSIIPKGDSVLLQLDIPEGQLVDSIVYHIDDQSVGSTRNNNPVVISTEGKRYGNHLLTAQYFQQGKMTEQTSNIIVVPTEAPAEYSFSVVHTFPHDPKAYTQGLEYHDGVLYESTGEYGESSLRKVDLNTGKVLQKIDLPKEQFGEGMTIVGSHIIQLTWQEGIGIVYDKNSFNKIKTFNYQASQEGWGLCFDGEKLIKSDGSNRLYFLDKDTYQETGYIEVFNHKGPVDSINELEYIDGKVYANLYTTDLIVIINPETGAIEGQLNLIGLLPQSHQTTDTNVLNGIAYDHTGKRLFVTGKNWDTLFEIKMLER